MEYFGFQPLSAISQQKFGARRLFIRPLRVLYSGLLTAVLFIAAAGRLSAQLPSPGQPILVIQDADSADTYQKFVPELLLTEGLNGFQTAQLAQLNSGFL